MPSDAEQDYQEQRRLWAVLHDAFFRRLRRWFGVRVYGIYSRPLKIPETTPNLEEFSYRVFQHDEAAELLSFIKNPGLNLSPEFVHAALEKGDACDVIIHNDEVVSYSWLAFSPTLDSDGVYISFRSSDRYGYKALTLPEFRGQHLRRLFKPMTDRYCIERGCTDAIAFIEITNRSSLKLNLALGNRLVGYAGYLVWGWLFVPFRSPGVRRREFRFSRRVADRPIRAACHR